jgi:hypothetical protein
VSSNSNCKILLTAHASTYISTTSAILADAEKARYEISEPKISESEPHLVQAVVAQTQRHTPFCQLRRRRRLLYCESVCLSAYSTSISSDQAACRELSCLCDAVARQAPRQHCGGINSPPESVATVSSTTPRSFIIDSQRGPRAYKRRTTTCDYGTSGA